MKKYIIIFLLMSALFCSCSKNDDASTCTENFSFISLESDKTSISVEETATITVHATGCKLKYLWEPSMGNVTAQGNQGIFVPSPCTAGEITIACTISDTNGESETKSIIITVE